MNQDDDIVKSIKLSSLWRLLRYALAYPRLLKEAAVLLLLATLGQVLGPVLVKIFIDDYITPGEYPIRELATLAFAYAVFYGLSAWAGYQNAMRFNEVAFSVVRTVRAQVFAAVMRKPLSYFDHRPTGSLVSRITNDTEAIKELFVQVMSTFVQNVTLIIAIFIAMAWLDLRLMLVCSIILPVVVTVMFFYQRMSSPRYHKARSVLSRINAILSESIQGMRIIQVLNQQKRFAGQFRGVSQELFNARMSNLRLDALMLRPLPDLLRTLMLAAVLLYFGTQSFTTVVEVGVIYAFVNYLSRITQPVVEMTQRLSLLQQAVVAGERVFGIIDEPGETQFATDQRITRGAVRFEQVGFSYDGEHPVLEDIDFSVAPGQFYAIVGHTGSGKSTLMSLLLRFYDPQQGRILLDDMPLADIDQRDLRAQVGVVLQDPFITVGTVRENITLGLDISEERIIEAARKAQLHDFVMSLPDGYDTKLGERGGNLSTGQRQLLSLARTLAREPRILILDEATANIDSHTEAVIQQALALLRGNTTILAIAHRLSTITSADSIIVLHQGHIMQQGSHQELLRIDGLYRHMYELQRQRALVEDAEIL
ncbi:MAG: ABC transporter transmembrane domain-containing protein [Gammaproteobacteria bacterium]|nr:ABC transporter transmembrane domain-containing protein [Gammaproteobacteria bacterium]